MARVKVAYMDHLSLDVAAAMAAGMSYGVYKHYHPETVYPLTEAPAAKNTVDKNASPCYSYRICQVCGRQFGGPVRSFAKYCSESCRYQMRKSNRLGVNR